jgi:hypothetical protein
LGHELCHLGAPGLKSALWRDAKARSWERFSVTALGAALAGPARGTAGAAKGPD